MAAMVQVGVVLHLLKTTCTIDLLRQNDDMKRMFYYSPGPTCRSFRQEGIYKWNLFIFLLNPAQKSPINIFSTTSYEICLFSIFLFQHKKMPENTLPPTIFHLTF